jgi:hypothetical protein
MLLLLLPLFMVTVVLLPAALHIIFSEKLQALQTSLPVPEKWQASESILLDLGFEPFGISQYRQKTKQGEIIYHTWTFFMPETKVYAFISDEPYGIRFSSYFEKGFVFTSAFKNGFSVESARYAEQVVNSSIEETYDIHLMERERFIGLHGEFMGFGHPRDRLTWEKSHKLSNMTSFGIAYSILRGFAVYISVYIMEMIFYAFFVLPRILAGDVSLSTAFPSFLVMAIAPLVLSFFPVYFSSRGIEPKKKRLVAKEKTGDSE